MTMKRPRSGVAVAAVAAAMVVVGGGCARDDDALRGDVQLVAALPEPSPRAVERLVVHGRRAIPLVEAALHTAEPPGRKNLLLLLRRIGDPDAVPLLRHYALYDPEPEVRVEAEWTLKQWAAGQDDRATKAREALRLLDELKQREGAG